MSATSITDKHEQWGRRIYINQPAARLSRARSSVCIVVRTQIQHDFCTNSHRSFGADSTIYYKKKLAKGLYLYKNESILKIMSFILCFHYSAHVANWLENFAVDTTKSLSSHQSLSSGKKAGWKEEPCRWKRPRMWRQRTEGKYVTQDRTHGHSPARKHSTSP